jgi:predicted CxxxxCH...CXXCH cytochrome family protein
VQTTHLSSRVGERLEPAVGRSGRAPLLLAAWVAFFLVACGRRDDAGAAPPAQAPPVQRLGAPSPFAAAAVTGFASAKTIHDGYVANGIACAACHPCGAPANHPLAWMDTTSSGFHAYSANQGLASCQECHGANLDGAGGTTTIACAQCHRPSGSGRDFGTCTGCHGGTDNASGAPPVATWGHAGDPGRGGGTLDPVRVGAHTAHVSSGPVTVGFDCSVCHVKPASMLDAGHVDGATATVTFGGVASTGTTPAWNRATATCASTYCHGATLVGGTATSPNWTVLDGSQAICTACHGNPPITGRHAPHSISWGVRCEVCHPNLPGYLVDPALHVNGAKNMNRSPTATRFGGFADWNPAAVGPGTLQGTATGCHGGIYYWTGSPPPGRFGCQ